MYSKLYAIVIYYYHCLRSLYNAVLSVENLDRHETIALSLYYILSVGSNSIETSYSMQDELRHVLSVLSEDKAKHLDIRKTKEVFIDQRSTAQ